MIVTGSDNQLVGPQATFEGALTWRPVRDGVQFADVPASEDPSDYVELDLVPVTQGGVELPAHKLRVAVRRHLDAADSSDRQTISHGSDPTTDPAPRHEHA